MTTSDPATNTQKNNIVTRTKSLSNIYQQRTLPVRSATTKHSDTSKSSLKKDPPIVRDISRRNVLESKNIKPFKRRSSDKIEPPLRNTSIRRNPKRVVNSGSSTSSSSTSSSSTSSSTSSHSSRHSKRISKDSKTSNRNNNSSSSSSGITDVSSVDENQLPWNQYSTIQEENTIKEFIKTDYTDMIQQLNASQAFLIASKFSTSSFGQAEELHQKSLQLKATVDSVYERIHVQTDTQRATVATLRLELLSLGKPSSDIQQLRESSLQIDQLVDELYFSNKRASDLESRYLQNVAGVLAIIISSGNKPPLSPHATNHINKNGLKLVHKMELLIGGRRSGSHESIIDNSMSDDSELLSPSSTRFSKLACASDTSADTDAQEPLDDLALYEKLNNLVNNLSEQLKEKEEHIATLEAREKTTVDDEAKQKTQLENLRALLKEESLKMQILEDKLKITEENHNLEQAELLNTQKEIQELSDQLQNSHSQFLNETESNQALIQNLKTQLEQISQNKQDNMRSQNNGLDKLIMDEYSILMEDFDGYLEPTNDAKTAVHMLIKAFRGLKSKLEICQQINQTQKEEDEFNCSTMTKTTMAAKKKNSQSSTKEPRNGLSLSSSNHPISNNTMNSWQVSEWHDNNLAIKQQSDDDFTRDILEQQLMETQKQLGLLAQDYKVAQQVYITRESAFILQSASLEAELGRILKEYDRLTRNITDFHHERKKWQEEIQKINNEKQDLDKQLSDEKLKRIAQDGQTKTLRKEFRGLVAAIKNDHATSIEREVALRRQVELALRDRKADEEMKRWERVDIAIQTEFDERIIATMRTAF